MSVRAYRINKIEYEKGNTFNLWHDQALMNEIEYIIGEQMGESGSGVFELQVELLENILKEVKDLDTDTRQALEKDVKWAKGKNRDYLDYIAI